MHWMGKVALAFCVLGVGTADARLPSRLFALSSDDPALDDLPVSLTLTLADEEPEHRYMKLGASLVSPLELASLEPGWSSDSPSDDIQPLAPIIHTAAGAPLRGALLDQCRFRMRKVRNIGKGASPDGRPTSCRLLSFAGRQGFRDRAALRRRGLRLRFRSALRPMLSAQGLDSIRMMLVMFPPAPVASRPAPTVAFARPMPPPIAPPPPPPRR